MARHAVAREVVCALRRQIAAIERTTGASPGRACPADEKPAVPGPPAVTGQAVRSPDPNGTLLMRRHGLALDRGGPGAARLATGAGSFDRILGGGLERSALCEIHGAEARNAGAAAGFALALASLVHKETGYPVLWVGTTESFRESGFPHAPGLQQAFAIPSQTLLLAETRKPLDALWIAGETAGLDALAAVIVELRGNPSCLDLTATRRLHRRARAAGRPVFLLRLSAERQPTAAPVRLCLSPAPAAPRTVFDRSLAGTIGAPAFTVILDKCRANPGRQFTLEWNCHDRRFHDRRAGETSANSVPVVSAPADRPHPAPALRQVLAFGPGRRRQAG